MRGHFVPSGIVAVHVLRAQQKHALLPRQLMPDLLRVRDRLRRRCLKRGKKKQLFRISAHPPPHFFKEEKPACSRMLTYADVC